MPLHFSFNWIQSIDGSFHQFTPNEWTQYWKSEQAFGSCAKIKPWTSEFVCVCLFVSACECVQVSNSCVDLLRSMFFWSCVDTRLLASLNSKKSPTLINVGFCSTNCVMSISAWLPNTCAVNWYIVERERERERESYWWPITGDVVVNTWLEARNSSMLFCTSSDLMIRTIALELSWLDSTLEHNMDDISQFE